jgi:DNA-directed RNA polymerase subunit RPC12/RpoP
MDMLKKYKCQRCNAEWLPRSEKPIACPRCKSTYWNKERVRPPKKQKPPKELPVVEILQP